MQIKTRVINTTYLLEYLKLKTRTTLSIVASVEQVEYSYIICQNAK